MRDPVEAFGPANPPYLVTELPPEQVYYSRTVDKQNEDELLASIELLRGLDYFGIAIAPFEAKTVMNSRGQEEYHVYATQVVGTSKPNFSHPGVATATDELCMALVGYYYDRVKAEELFLIDIDRPDQFVYGVSDIHRQSTFVLVDLDLLCSEGVEVAVDQLENMVEFFIKPMQQAQPGRHIYAAHMLREVLMEFQEIVDDTDTADKIATLLSDPLLDVN